MISEHDTAPPADLTDAVYAYAVLLRNEAAELAVRDLSGVDGLPVRILRGAGTAAVVSDVPAEAFTEEAIAQRLDDINDLERLARDHHQVIAALAARTAVLPLRLATVYIDDGSLLRRLHADAGHFRSTLNRLEGHDEWGVKIYAHPPTATPSPGDRPRSGRDYLRARRTSRDGHDLALRTAADLGARVDRMLAEANLASDVRHHRPQPATLSAKPGENVVNAAYLVPRKHTRSFQDRVEVLAAGTAGVRLEITGPWAPYSFASPPPEQAETTDPAIPQTTP
ncbi:GvpL/GvpF family gas vesicle protein [Streptomyces sp. SID12488]|uniref:GvpL/GvpF family gas vesicle protein n=1 Tax=Streptomyces sp. SID12488 TaxID=2706040 RepID=UPI0013DD1994|nr:GvpL/GvpF family gas vesicle protein [Streptomyces sp. SID12488]NEA63366.1 GvpL/GvpF family gas vesicle protein [Streptomyces sp. SID12488]